MLCVCCVCIDWDCCVGGEGGAGDADDLAETMSQASLDSKASGNPAPRKKPYGGGGLTAGMGLERQEVRGCILLLLFMLSKRNVYAFIQALGGEEMTEAGDESGPEGISQLDQLYLHQHHRKGGALSGRRPEFASELQLQREGFERKRVREHTRRLNKFVAEANGGGGGSGGGSSSTAFAGAGEYV